MLQGVGIVCFVGSYLLALALEISRLFFKSRVRGALLAGSIAAGLLAHSLYLYHHAVYAVGLPLSSQRDWCLVAAWGVVVLNLVLTLERPGVPFGLLFLPTALAFIAVGVLLGSAEPFPREPASRLWGIVHGVSILASVLAVVIGFFAGTSYLWQAGRLKSGRPPLTRLRLPSLEWLEKASSKSLFFAVLLLGIGVLSGVILGRINPDEPLSPYDPFVGGTLVLFGCLAAASAGLAFSRGASSGRRAALVAVASFAVLLAVLAVGLSGLTRHGGVITGGSPHVERTEVR